MRVYGKMRVLRQRRRVADKVVRRKRKLLKEPPPARQVRVELGLGNRRSSKRVVGDELLEERRGG